MAITKKELVDWLAQFNDAELIAVDDGGLTLVVVDDSPHGLKVQPELEIGGITNEEDSEDVNS